MKLYKSLNNKGFTLLELLIVVSIIGVISFFAISITSSMKDTGKLATTKSNMEIIAKKAREFYRGHGDLPKASQTSGTVPALDINPPPTGNMVPVDANAFEMEPKYRLDAWGRYFLYFTYTNDGNGNRPGERDIDEIGGGGQLISFDPATGSDRTLIRGINFNDSRVAGIIISSGPDQVFNYSATETALALSINHNNYFKTYILDAGSDDIIVLIDVSQEAFEMANNELLFLNQKVKAFDAMHEGIDNDNDGQVDENANVATLSSDCPLPNSIGYLSNDPNNGAATLDVIKSNAYGRTLPPPNPCSTSSCRWDRVNPSSTSFDEEIEADEARAYIYCLYNLQADQVVDPWLNGYIWGYGSTPVPPNPIITGYAKSDKQYHRFYSAGPDAKVGPGFSDDDITP